MTKELEVVQGLLVDPTSKKVLMAYRPPTKKIPLMWEYPGGKVEPGESLPEALKRELEEELDIDVVVGEHIAKARFYWNEDIVLYLFAIKELVGEPKPLASMELVWVDPYHAVEYMPCSPTAFGVYRDVIRYLKRLP